MSGYWCIVFQAKKSQTVETNLKNITLAKFDLDFEVSTYAIQYCMSFTTRQLAALLLGHITGLACLSVYGVNRWMERQDLLCSVLHGRIWCSIGFNL